MINIEALKIAPRGYREIVVTRDFYAPRETVFDNFTKPELLKQWFFGPPGWSLAICEIDLKVGGKYRYVWRNESDGATMGSGGVFHEVAAPERFVGTERFDVPWYPGEALGTFDFIEQGGRTILTMTLRYESQEARDAVLKSGMEQGLAEGYDRLAEMLSSAQSKKAA